MTLPRWIGRVAAIAFTVFIVAATAQSVILPIFDRYVSNQNAVADARFHLSRYARAETDRDALQAQLSALQRRSSGQDGIYLTGKTEALAAADLQDRVRAVIRAHLGELRSIQAIANRSDGVFKTVNVRVQMTANTETLYRVLYDLETETPYVFLDNLSIRSSEGTAGNVDPMLHVQFNVFGYLPLEEG